MSENPRQFGSIDSSDAGLSGSVTNRPSSGTIANQPIDYAKHFDVERQIIDYQKQNGTYEPRSSAAESALQAEQKAASDAAWRQSVKQAKAAQEIQAQHEQAQRTELLNRLKGEASTPSPFSDESDRNRIRRMNDLPPIDEPPPSTPERQPLPSTGSPPPTLNGTAARADSLVEPTATPRPAMLREAIATTAGNAISALPRALPQSAGRLVVPGVGAALSIGSRLVVGQSVTQAVTSTGAGLIGTGIGAIAGTAIGGPIGGYVGGMIGGTAASLFSDWLFFQNIPTTAAKTQETYIPNYPPINQGQAEGVMYRVSFSWEMSFNGNYRGTQLFDAVVRGPIKTISLGIPPGLSSVGAYVIGTNADGSDQLQSNSFGYYPATEAKGMQFLSISRVDGRSDITPGVQQPLPPIDNMPSYAQPSPLGNDATIPSGAPAAGQNKGKTREIAPSMPSNNTPNGGGAFPGHGGLAPSYLPNPTQTPSNLGGMLPSIKNAPQPLPFAEPDDVAVPRGSSTGSSSFATTSANPGTFAFPAYAPEIAQPVPINDGLSPTPKKNAHPSVKTPSQLSNDGVKTALEQQKKDFDKQIAQMTGIAGILAGLTPIVQGIPDAIANSPTVQAANKETTQGAVCEIAQPGGCLGNALDNAANNVNQNNNQNTANLLDKINAGANAAQLALLETINTKLGAQLVGGISGFLQNFFEGFNKLTEWLHLDRALNLLTFIMTVQNVYFLCDSMKVVTLQMISDTLAVFGIKDKDNNPLNLNEILGHEVESLLKSILGEQELTGMKQEWKALNRIFQAATNMLFAIQNMVFSVLQALEIIGSWNASIGNALKKYLVVGQNAFNWMNQNPNFHNNFFKFLGEALNVVTSLDFIAQSILQGRQAIDDFGKQTDEVTKSMTEASDGFKPPENKARADAATASANVSKSPIPSPEDINSLQ